MSVVVELKYCERCGGLWLRRTKTDGVVCAECVHKMRTAFAGVGWHKYLRRKEYTPKPSIEAAFAGAGA
jgi:Zn-finger nucleic acid-binding protein